MTLVDASPANMVRPKAAPKTATKTAPTPDLRHRRGEVWMVAADPGKPAVGTEIWSDRPAVIVSNNVINSRAGFAQVVYLSTSARKRSGPTHVVLPAPDGKGEAMALCEQIHTVDASRLRRHMSTVPDEFIRELDAAMALSLSLSRNPDTHTPFRKWEEHIKKFGIDMAAEISALSGQTTDQRVEALAHALELTTVERDSYRNLYEAAQERPAAMRDVAEALSQDG